MERFHQLAEAFKDGPGRYASDKDRFEGLVGFHMYTYLSRVQFPRVDFGDESSSAIHERSMFLRFASRVYPMGEHFMGGLSCWAVSD